MSKQTAVDYLVKELSAILGRLETKPMQDLLMVDAINKAKQMEREQSMELIELTSQLTGVATVDEEIAKMEYIDVYNQYYKGGQ